MKRSKLLKRMSAFTMAAAVTAANAAFNYVPAARSLAVDTQEETAAAEPLMTQKSEYPTTLNYFVEQNDDGEYILKVSDTEYFNRFFTAEVVNALEAPEADNEADEDNAGFPEEGVALDADGEYSVIITAKYYDENEEPVFNPYVLISGEEEEDTDGETQLLSAELPVDLSAVNAAADTIELDEEEELDYYVVKSEDSYELLIPDDYDKLFVNSIEESQAELEINGEAQAIDLESVELDINLITFAELKTQALFPDDTYSVERFCEDEEIPYYYGEIIKVTPAESYKVTIGSGEYLKPVPVQINGDEITGEEIRYSIEVQGSAAGSVEVTANAPIEDGTVLAGTEVTIAPTSALDGRKFTITANGETFENKAAVFTPTDNVVVNVEDKGEVELLERASDDYVKVAVGPFDDTPGVIAFENNAVRIGYMEKKQGITVKKLIVTSTDGKSAEIDTVNRTVTQNGLIITPEEGGTGYMLSNSGLHGDITVKVEYTLEVEVSFNLNTIVSGEQGNKNSLIKEIEINGNKYTFKRGKLYSGESEADLESTFGSDMNTFKFYVEKDFSFESITYTKDGDNDNSIECNDYKTDGDYNTASMTIENDMHGANQFFITLTKKAFTQTVRVLNNNSENCKVGIGESLREPNKTGNNTKYWEKNAYVSGFDLSIQPAPGYYVSKINYYAASLSAEERAKNQVTVYEAGSKIGSAVIDEKGILTYKVEDVTEAGDYVVTLAEAEETVEYVPVINANEGNDNAFVLPGEITDKSRSYNLLEQISSYSVALGEADDTNRYSLEKEYGFSDKVVYQDQKLEKDSETYVFYILDDTTNIIKKETVIINKGKSEPVITKVNVKTEKSLLRFLTFGIFGKDTVEITVYAQDAEYGLDIESIVLKNGNTIIENDAELKQVLNQNVYYKEWSLTDGEYKLSAYASTNPGGTAIVGTPYTISISEDGELTTGESKEFSVVPVNTDNNAVDVILESGVPTVEISPVFGENKTYKGTDRTWTNGDFSFDITAKDNDSGINNIVYILNSDEQTIQLTSSDKGSENYVATLEASREVTKNIPVSSQDELAYFELRAGAEDNSGNAIGKNDYDLEAVSIDREIPVVDANAVVDGAAYNGEWTNKPITITVTAVDNGSGAASIAYTTEGTVNIGEPQISGTSEKLTYVYTVSPNSSGTIKFTAKDNVDNESNEKSVTVNTETTAPVITNFVPEGVGKVVDEYSPDFDDGLNEYYNFYITPYGYYFENTVQVTVDGYDSGEISSGVRSIQYGFVDYSNMDSDYYYSDDKISDISNVDADHAVFSKGEFNGQIVARVIDNAGNVSKWYTPDGVVVETQAMHDADCHAYINMSATSYTDRSGSTPLYDAAPTAELIVEDPYSGIESITWYVGSSSGTVLEESSVSFAGLTPGSSADGWQLEWKRNIVVRATKTVSISTAAEYQQNGLTINLSFMDNSKFDGKAAPKTFSIDTVAPVIVSSEISGTPRNEKYYNQNRVATIKVRERNLNTANTDELIKVTLTNQLGSVAKGYTVSSWTDESPSNIESDSSNLHTITVTFNADAEYSFGMDVEDKTGKKASVPSASFIIDKTAPQLNLSFDNNASSNGSYYKDSRKATISITEHNFDAAKGMNFTLSAYEEDNVTSVDSKTIVGEGLKWTKSNTVPDLWTAQISFNSDGRYSFGLSYIDLAGNSGNNIGSETFYIDKTAPVIEQSFTTGNKDKVATNGSLVPKVSFTDYNLPAENQALTSCTVTIEKIDVNGPTSKSYSATARTYTAAAKDIPAVFESIYDIFGDSIENDGIYDVSISATDLAGNTTENLHRIVSINRYGSTYEIVNDEAKEAVEKFKNNIPVNTDTEVVIREINVSEISKDRTITVLLDNTNSSVLGKNDYKVEDSRTADDDNGWYEAVYTIDKKNFESDGNYLVNIESSDSAGNKNSNNTPVYEERKCSVAFAVDKTLPEVIISGVDDNAVLKEAEVSLTITCSDRNLRKATELTSDDLTVNINDIAHDVDDLRQMGASVKNDASDNIIISVPVKADGKNSKNEISVEIKDKAGNVSDPENSSIEFELSASFFARHGILAIILIALGVLVLGAGGVLVAKKVRE